MFVLSTDSLRGYGLNRIFHFAKEAGYDGIDLQLDLKNFDTYNASYVKSLIQEFNLPVVAIQTPPNINPHKILDTVKMAKELGSRIIIIQPPRIFDFKYIQWLKNEIPRIRQKENISIALENAPSQTFLGFIPEHAMGNFMDLKKFKHACLDTTRVAQKHEELIRIYKFLKKYLVHIHFSNVKMGKQYFLPQEGILPLESFLTRLKQDGFAGNISLKVNSKFLNAGDDEKVHKNLVEAKAFFDKHYTNAEVVPVSGEFEPDEE